MAHVSQPWVERWGAALKNADSASKSSNRRCRQTAAVRGLELTRLKYIYQALLQHQSLDILLKKFKTRNMTFNDNDISGRLVLITGASGG